MQPPLGPHGSLLTYTNQTSIKTLTNVHQKVSLVIKYLHCPIVLLLPHHEDPDYLCKPDIHQHPYAPWGPKIPDMKAESAQQSISLKPVWPHAESQSDPNPTSTRT